MADVMCLAASRFRLRPAVPADVDRVQRAGLSADSLWIGVPHPCPPARARQVVDELGKDWDGDFGLGRFVSPLTTDEIHGLVCVLRRTPSTVEVSYGIAPDHRRRGLATAVLAEVTGYILDQTDWASRVEVVIAPTNQASLRVAAKAGFARDGHRRGTAPGNDVVYNDMVLARGPVVPMLAALVGARTNGSGRRR
ncbi:MAG TPA: GNAT family N-acetyltransferase [Actinopolymorphaceae bacterium]